MSNTNHSSTHTDQDSEKKSGHHELEGDHGSDKPEANKGHNNQSHNNQQSNPKDHHPQGTKDGNRANAGTSGNANQKH